MKQNRYLAELLTFCLVFSVIGSLKNIIPISVLRITVDNIRVSAPYIGHTDIVPPCSASNM